MFIIVASFNYRTTYTVPLHPMNHLDRRVFSCTMLEANSWKSRGNSTYW